MGLFILDGVGDFSQGFTVRLRVWSGELPSLDAMDAGASGKLLEDTELPKLYQAWQITYRNYIEIRAYNPNDNNSAAFMKERLVPSRDPQEWNNQKRQAYSDCIKAEKALLNQFHKWLNCPDFWEVKAKLREYLAPNKDQANRILIESNDLDFQKMPWQKWDLLKTFSRTEVGLSSPNFEKRYVPIKPKERARVLVILGKDANIQQEVKELAKTNKVDGETRLDELIEYQFVTTLAELDECLWNEAWDIIVFNGHSGTSEKGTQGQFQLSDGNILEVSGIRGHFNKAIEQGLKLVIFNSCDGLGLAHQLGEGEKLYLPQIIVMRDFLPVPLAPIFLQSFFNEFIKKKIPLYSAVRATRDRLQIREQEFPCASWLPVLCQNPAESSFFLGDFTPPKPETDEVKRKAEAKFPKLAKFLKDGEWKKADQETGKVMLKIMNRESQGYLTAEDCQNFPREELKIIDDLWVKYSDGKFGFSVQKEIYIKWGGTPGEYNSGAWEKLAEEVGWKKGGSWLSYSDITFNKESPKGHLPSGVVFFGSWLWIVWEGDVCFLFSLV